MTTNQSIFADINCKGGVAMLVGVIVKETKKAVKIDYALEPIFVGSAGSPVTIANRTAWVPKSQITENKGACEIKKWFANKALKGFNIKPYQI
jgi:hypothetical protein